jgi:hypothetical protein
LGDQPCLWLSLRTSISKKLHLGPQNGPESENLLKIVNCQNGQKTVLSHLEKVGGPRYPPGSNVVTPSGNYSIPTMVVTTGEFPPPNPPSPVQATMVSTTSTSHSSLILSMAMTTTPFTPSAAGPLFSYQMPSLGTSPVLSYSTSKTLCLRTGSSDTPL